MKDSISPRDIEALSAYIDGQLSARERERLEARLRSQAALSKMADELRQLRLLLRRAPYMRAPRNFTLSPQMVRARPQPRLYPALGIASAVSSLLLIVVVAGDFILSGGLRAAPGAESAVSMEVSQQTGAPTQPDISLPAAAPLAAKDSGITEFTPQAGGSFMPTPTPQAALMEQSAPASGLYGTPANPNETVEPNPSRVIPETYDSTQPATSLMAPSPGWSVSPTSIPAALGVLEAAPTLAGSPQAFQAGSAQAANQAADESAGFPNLLLTVEVILAVLAIFTGVAAILIRYRIFFR